MTDSLKHTPPSKPRHYIIVVHGMGDQKCHTTIPPVVHRFAEVRHPKDESHRKIIVPSTISSHAVRSENERHGWAEFKGIPIEAVNSTGHFDGGAATDSSGENFRFVEMYWQDILQDNQERYASSVEEWSKALLNRLNDPEITPKGWLPEWAVPMLSSIVNTAIPLKKYFAIKNNEYVKIVFDEFLGDVHLYGDYSRTRGEAVRHFHAVLDKIIFFDFLDWRIQELTVSRLNHEEVIPRPYEKPEISIIAHSLGSVLSFDAIVYAYVKKHIRSASAENAEFSDSFPFTGYTYPSSEEHESYNKNTDRLNRFDESVKRYFQDRIRDDIRMRYYDGYFDEIYKGLASKGYMYDDIIKEMKQLSCKLDGVFLDKQIVHKYLDGDGKSKNRKDYLEYNVSVSINVESDDGGQEEEIEDLSEMISDFKKILKRDLNEIITFVNEKIGEDGFAGELHRMDKHPELLERKVMEIADEMEMVIKRDIKNNLNSYWDHFLDGFSKLDDGKYLSMSKRNRPELSIRKDGGNPLLLWRSCIKNFITLGSPIDKYIALWRQNYVHLGLTMKGLTTPEEWDLPLVCQYDFAQIHRINHYNFCDEQDPVGHHLDLTRMTKIYGKIFKNADNAYRDVVFRRYGVPGLAHNMYWSDAELFRGILREIIDRRDDKSSSFFVKDSFREKANAEKQGFLWAYFRIPALAALITTIFLVYAIFKPEALLSRSIALLLMMLLWFMPSFIAFYRSRANVSDVDKKSFRLVLEKPFSKGILSNLLCVAVEWRRILCVQSEGDSVDKENIHSRISFQSGDFNPFSWSFYWRWIWRVSFSIIILLVVVTVIVLIDDSKSLTEIFHWQKVVDIWAGFGDKSELKNLLTYKEKEYYKIALLSVILLSVVYLLVMIYEMNIFIKTKKKYYKNRSGYFGKLLKQLDAMMRSGKQ